MKREVCDSCTKVIMYETYREITIETFVTPDGKVTNEPGYLSKSRQYHLCEACYQRYYEKLILAISLLKSGMPFKIDWKEREEARKYSLKCMEDKLYKWKERCLTKKEKEIVDKMFKKYEKYEMER